MKTLRFSIAEMMVLVLLAAIDMGIIRLLVTLGPPGQFGDLILVGALPMGNILALATVYGLRRRRRDGLMPSSLARVLGWGSAALAVWITCFAVFTEPMHDGFGHFAVSLTGWQPRSVFAQCVFLAILVVSFLVPPLAVAFVGSRLPSKYRIRIVIERRDAAGRQPDPQPQGPLPEPVS
jgi:hypothetical protein